MAPFYPTLDRAKPGFPPFPLPRLGLGYAMVNLRSNWAGRSYLSQQLPTSLIAGATYCIEFYTAPWAFNDGLSKDLGVLFTADSLDYYAYEQNPPLQLALNYVISDTAVWTHITGSFVANGTERYINFGNFKSADSTVVVPSGFIRPGFWAVVDMTSYLIDAVQLYNCSDTLYNLTLPPDTLLCPGQSLILHPMLQGFLLEDTTTTYLWSTGSTDSSIVVTQPGTYWVQTTINQRFLAADTIRVAYFPVDYTLGLPDTVTFCEGTMATLAVNPDPTNLTAYIWSTGATLTGIQTRASGQYWVRATTPCGTLADTSWVLQDFCETHLWIPNAFTPDGDGTNDFFAFMGAPEPVALSIYDRWGKLVFYSPDYKNEWDGTYQGNPLPLGVYTYLIEYRYINPNATTPNPKGSERQARGTVTLLR